MSLDVPLHALETKRHITRGEEMVAKARLSRNIREASSAKVRQATREQVYSSARQRALHLIKCGKFGFSTDKLCASLREKRTELTSARTETDRANEVVSKSMHELSRSSAKATELSKLVSDTKQCLKLRRESLHSEEVDDQFVYARPNSTVVAQQSGGVITTPLSCAPKVETPLVLPSAVAVIDSVNTSRNCVSGDSRNTLTVTHKLLDGTEVGLSLHLANPPMPKSGEFNQGTFRTNPLESSLDGNGSNKVPQSTPSDPTPAREPAGIRVVIRSSSSALLGYLSRERDLLVRKLKENGINVDSIDVQRDFVEPSGLPFKLKRSRRRAEEEKNERVES